MIARVDIASTNLVMSKEIAKYIKRKIGRLDRYLPRNARKTAHVTVTMRELDNRAGSKYMCEVVLVVPGDTIAAKDSTLNQFAAVDIVEAKLKNQIRKYKEQHIGHLAIRRRAMLRRVRERFFANPA